MSVIGVLVLFFPGSLLAADTAIPRRAAHFKRDLIREVQAFWGLQGSAALFAAQIHKESTWKPHAKSKYAKGLAQFTPRTGAWLTEKFPEELGTETPFSPKWSLRAMVLYDRNLHGRVETFERGGPLKACDQWAFALSAYNGGMGWLIKDRKLTRKMGKDPNRWWGHVEDHSKRAKWAKRENRDYPRKVLEHYQLLYREAGWPGPPICRDRQGGADSSE